MQSYTYQKYYPKKHIFILQNLSIQKIKKTFLYLHMLGLVIYLFILYLKGMSTTNDVLFANLNSSHHCDRLKNLATPLLSKKTYFSKHFNLKTLQPQNTSLTPLEHSQINSLTQNTQEKIQKT